MTELATLDAYGTLVEPTTLKIQRLLPGPIDRVWAYLTQSDLRRQWLAAGDMAETAGAAFTLTWRNGELGDGEKDRPADFGEEHSMDSRIVEIDPPRKLVFTWSNSGDVSIELTPVGSDVILTLIHRRLPSRDFMLSVSAGWHAHLDQLVAKAGGKAPPSFWSSWLRLKGEYDARLPA